MIDVQALEDKFNGVHPAAITLEELSWSQHQWVRKAAASGGIRSILSAPSQCEPLESSLQVCCQLTWQQTNQCWITYGFERQKQSSLFKT
jgi:hypothetical protein